MAQIQKLNLIADIELQLNQGSVSDDSELDRRQIAFWIDYELNQLIKQECEASMKLGKQIPPLYIRTSAANLLDYDSTTEPFPGLNATGTLGTIYWDNTNGDYYKWSNAGWIKITQAEADYYYKTSKKWINFNCNSVMDILNDNGIVRITTDEGDLVHKSTVRDIDTLKHLRFSGPSDEALVWYRVQDTIFVEGISISDIIDNIFFIDYVAKSGFLSASDTATFNISDSILPMLIDRVLQRGKLQLYGTTPDVANDGVDYKQPVYHTAVTNPTRGDQTAQQQQQ